MVGLVLTTSLRLTTLTAFVLFILTTTLFAQKQRYRNTVLYSAENSPSGQVAGKITGNAGPMDGVRVILTHEGKVISDLITGVNGTYEFKGLLPGRYDISCFKTDYRKHIINEIPVLENHLTRIEIKLLVLNDWREERNPKTVYYEDLKDTKIEKLK
ncbi:MAG: carboxypeptidase-like regulatory domain-containing protein [Chitinophagales bacterium]